LPAILYFGPEGAGPWGLRSDLLSNKKEDVGKKQREKGKARLSLCFVVVFVS